MSQPAMDWTATLQQWLGIGATGIVEAITDAGGPVGWLIALHLVFVWAGIHRGLQLSLIAAITLISNTWLKILIAEPRPYWVINDLQALRTTTGFGMPSGHAQGAMAFWGYLAILARRAAPLVALLLVLLVIRRLRRSRRCLSIM